MKLYGPLIVDTDIGEDVDDALALFYLGRLYPQQLVGVTTVYGRTDLKAAIAVNLLALLGLSDVGVYMGEGCSLSRGGKQKPPCQYEAVASEFRNKSYGNGVDFICCTAEKAEKLTILTLGPLTNIALAIQKTPKAMEKVQLVIMGGMTNKAFPEGNIATDPEAAEIVFTSPIEKCIVPLDLTLPWETPYEILSLFYEGKKEIHQYMSRLIRLWQDCVFAPMLKSWGRSDDPHLMGTGAHDLIAAVFCTHGEFFKQREAMLRVETTGKYTRGVTVDDMNVFSGLSNGKNCIIATDMDEDKVFEVFRMAILGKEIT